MSQILCHQMLKDPISLAQKTSQTHKPGVGEELVFDACVLGRLLIGDANSENSNSEDVLLVRTDSIGGSRSGVGLETVRRSNLPVAGLNEGAE